jgi:hypothetical protein
MPIVCYTLLIAAEVFATALMLLPEMSTLTFASLYVLTPALVFFLALLLCATDTKLFLKLPFPLVALAILPLGLLLRESDGGAIVESGHFWADFGFALLIALAPALLGMAMGLIIWAVGRKRGRQLTGRGKTSGGGKTSDGASRGAQSGSSKTSSKTSSGTRQSGGRKPGANPMTSGPKLRVASKTKTNRKR